MADPPRGPWGQGPDSRHSWPANLSSTDYMRANAYGPDSGAVLEAPAVADRTKSAQTRFFPVPGQGRFPGGAPKPTW